MQIQKPKNLIEPSRGENRTIARGNIAPFNLDGSIILTFLKCKLKTNVNEIKKEIRFCERKKNM